MDAADLLENSLYSSYSAPRCSGRAWLRPIGRDAKRLRGLRAAFTTSSAPARRAISRLPSFASIAGGG